MSSSNQVKANQWNAQKSTGPKTEEGKAVVSQNAMKHGLLSTETLLPWEESAELNCLLESLTTALKPDGPLEKILVDRIVSLTWRLRRAGRIESGILVWKKYSELFDQAKAEFDTTYRIEDTFSIDLNGRHEVIPNEARYKAAKKKLSEASRMVNSDLPVLGRIFEGCADVMGNLHRYETGIERSLLKTLRELRNLQASKYEQCLASAEQTQMAPCQ